MADTVKKKKTGGSVKVKVKYKEPSLYDVIMHNDDVTTMDFVVEILMDIFDNNNADAVTLMMKIHKEGMARVARYSFDIAETKRQEALNRARAASFPLKITLDRV